MVDEPPILPTVAPPQMIATRTTSFTPYFGHLATGSAFQILGGLLSAAAGSVDSAATVKPLWHSTSAMLCLTKGS